MMDISTPVMALRSPKSSVPLTTDYLHSILHSHLLINSFNMVVTFLLDEN